VAYLHGKTIRQRAEALIQVADPRFRDELEEFAVESKLLGADRARVAV
jgi:acyl-CoA hydrolase